METGAAGLAEVGDGLGAAGFAKACEGAEAVVVGSGFFVHGKTHAMEEGFCFLEIVEFLFLYFVLLMPLAGGFALDGKRVTGLSLQVDVGGDPAPAAGEQAVADVLAKSFFFRVVEIDQEAFVDDGDGAGWKPGDDLSECGGVEDVEGL